jgi:hypothetical protein
MKTIMACALIIMSLSACIPDGLCSQASDNTDHMVQVGDIHMGYRIYGNGYPLVVECHDIVDKKRCHDIVEFVL